MTKQTLELAPAVVPPILCLVMLSVIPYFPPPTVNLPGLGPTPPFGLLVVIGIIIGWKITLRQIDKRGVDTGWARDLLWWTVVTGMIVAKLFDTIFYSHELSLRTGLSSTGGFIGAAIGFIAYFHKHPQYKHLRLLLADTIAIGLAVAWIFGRMGCFVVHDHKGLPTDFFLGIDFPDGRHHDLGFYEMTFTALMAAVLHLLNLRPRPIGFFIGLVGVLYGPVRFYLDFLRPETSDARYVMLTPAQWGAVALTLFGIWTLARAFRGRTAVEIAGAPGAKGADLAEPSDASGSKATASKPKSGGKKKKRKKR